MDSPNNVPIEPFWDQQSPNPTKQGESIFLKGSSPAGDSSP